MLPTEYERKVSKTVEKLGGNINVKFKDFETN